eukprot:NODE_3292_length_791_cov_64.820755_g2749_i0.p1 GENE.NODE_3292_length_791_cov_64.820755_g2749_i0~~NODE_3292_length_791_cov_64.820755_g2749_i0.p1  ORF type:complete len:82 (+),score=2.65 NODE_3292_length_791_cov_64.820755_g2749_i0:141-386(+)
MACAQHDVFLIKNSKLAGYSDIISGHMGVGQKGQNRVTLFPIFKLLKLVWSWLFHKTQPFPDPPRHTNTLKPNFAKVCKNM